MGENQHHNQCKMIPLFRPAILAVVLASSACETLSGTLELSAKERWLVVASTKDVDTAIGIAAHYPSEAPRVVEAHNGWYAVVMGPYDVRSLRDLRNRKFGIPALPLDALLSRGNNYRDTIWQQVKPPELPWQDVSHGKPTILKSGETEFSVALGHVQKNQTSGPVTLSAKNNSGRLFEFTFVDNGFSFGDTNASIARLDRESETPQLVLTTYTGGAHCCMKTWLVTKPAGNPDWIMLELEELDGQGLGFRDLNGDGVLEIAQYDNNFLYTFDSYSSSFEPVKYLALSGDQLVDISNTGIASSALRQDIASLEFEARLNPENWRRNGFLAAWVASKVRLGQGEDAWATMLENFDRDSQFNQQECLTGAEIEVCDPKLVRDIPFPHALARLLEVTGYGPLPQGAVGTSQ